MPQEEWWNGDVEQQVEDDVEEPARYTKYSGDRQGFSCCQ
jgi:hypothetical protein